MAGKVIGPTGSRRRRWSLLVPLIAAAAVALFMTAGSQAVNNTGAFELDGNAVNGAASGDDWDNVCHQVTAGGFDSAGHSVGALCASASNTTGATAVSWTDATKGLEIYTGGGSKDFNDPEDSWLWKPKDTVPDKDTILHSFAARYSLPKNAATCPAPATATTCEVIFFGSDRFDNSGDAQLGFWFFQSRVQTTGTASNGGFKFSGHHQTGDLLVISDFSNGGTTSTIKVYSWNPAACPKADSGSEDSVPVGGCPAKNLKLEGKSSAANCASSAATSNFCGIVNPSDGTTAPWPFLDKTNHTNFQQGEFYEAGLNLSGLGFGNECFSSVVAESRSSDSTSAVLKDFVLSNFGECTSGLVTTPSAGKNGSVAIGSNGTVSVTDSAALTISGAATWSGTLKFFFCGPLSSGSCDGTTNVGTQVGSDRTVTNSDSQPFVSDAKVISAANATGEYYCWRATFTATTTGVPNAADGSSTECFTVTPLTPTIATQVKKASDDSNVSNGGTVPIGTTVYDTATLSGSTTNAGGTVRYRLYTNNTCTTLDTSTAGTAFNSQADVTVANATVPKSANITLNTAGTFYFQATYQTGDANNVAGAKSACTSETVIVQAAPVVHSTPQVQIRDSVTVTGLSASPTGNLTVGIYTDNTCTTRLAGTSDETFAIGGTQPFVTNFQGVVAGTYYYKLSYPGDTNNAGFTSCDENVGVTITAKP